jgi:hypothetical protein
MAGRSKETAGPMLDAIFGPIRSLFQCGEIGDEVVDIGTIAPASGIDDGASVGGFQR